MDKTKKQKNPTVPTPFPASTSYRDAVRGSPPTGSSGTSDVCVEPTFTSDQIDLLRRQFPQRVVISTAKFSSSVAGWSNSLIGKTLGREVSSELLSSALSSQWSAFGEFEVFTVANGFHVFRFHSPEARDSVLFGGPWVVDGAVLALSSFDPSFRPSACQLVRAVIWVRLPDLPPSFWSDEVITDILSVVGRVVRLDEYTRLRTRGKYARVAVEIDLRQPLLPGIIVDVESGEVDAFWQHFQYEHIHSFCSRCRRVGHRFTDCAPTLETGLVGDGGSIAASVNEGTTFSIAPTETIPIELASKLMVRRRRNLPNNNQFQLGGQARISKTSMDLNLKAPTATPHGKSTKVGTSVDVLETTSVVTTFRSSANLASQSGLVHGGPRLSPTGLHCPSTTLANGSEQSEPTGSFHSAQPTTGAIVERMDDGEPPIFEVDNDESRLVQEIMQEDSADNDDSDFTLASLKKKKGKGKSKEICLRLEPHKRSSKKKVKLGDHFGEFSLLQDLMGDATPEEIAAKYGPTG